MNLRHAAFTALALATAGIGASAGCKPKPDPVVDAGVAPPPTTPATMETALVPMGGEDAGPDASDAGDAGKKTGPSGNPNVARLKACCNQLAAEGKRLGASPEGGMLVAAAAQCNAMAAQASTSGNAAEMGVIRNLLQGRNVPPVCGGF
ncbi:MAG: hypothetical protein U0174_05425 [Polyangiaceae bacterium]